MSKIDIVMATYNGEKYISEQIDSIINQTYTNWNLIIRDDGSKDGTVAIIKNYEKRDSRIKVVEDNLGNLGFNKNFELLLRTSSEEFIMVSDQDDIWMSDKIEKSNNEIKKMNLEEPSLVFFNSQMFNEKDGNIGLHIDKHKGKGSFDILIGENFCQGATLIMNRKLKNKVIPFIEGYVYDYAILLNAELYGEWKYVDAPVMMYRIHSLNQIGKSQENINFYKRLKKDYYRYNEIFKKINNNKIIVLKNKDIVKDRKTTERFLRVFDTEKNRIKRIITYLAHFFEIRDNIKIYIFLNLIVNSFKKEISFRRS